ncbi:hypothetical protein ACIOEZ_08120 [Streptomyces sp. NPDC087866]|uniref:hypothetical protein n=1 Tax=unclassified Streptomyces TaxID=2593676 RepID=UPI0022530B40|nr:hypothetical protein [Streptomyces sp. NBC_01789]MCX4445055.1 hypothetical protein [Streptomyces sp. NBC_01789]
MSDLDARSWRSVAWRVAVPVLVFSGSTTMVMTLRFSWTPRADSDRWAVAMVVAVFLSSLAASAFEWIRSSGGTSRPGNGPASAGRQHVTAGRDSENIVAREDIGVDGPGAPLPGARRRAAAPLDQRVKSGRRSRNIVAGGSVALPPEQRE